MTNDDNVFIKAVDRVRFIATMTGDSYEKIIKHVAHKSNVIYDELLVIAGSSSEMDDGEIEDILFYKN